MTSTPARYERKADRFNLEGSRYLLKFWDLSEKTLVGKVCFVFEFRKSVIEVMRRKQC